ncbi:MAG: hypothetical protein AAF696_25150 [Bacteroidota bacterium]
MRHLIILLSLAFSLQSMSCVGNNFAADTSVGAAYDVNISSDSLLAGVQMKIFNAFVASNVNGTTSQMEEIESALEKLYSESSQKLIMYWRAYVKYYLSIAHMQKGNEKQSEKEIDMGIRWLKEMKNKNSEDYALLAMMQGFSLQFKGMKVMFLSSKVKANAKTAVELDPENIRANFVYASNDFYTPETYGGGKEAESYLLKALSLPAQKIENAYLPSWGREEAYEMLIKLYIKAEKWSKAKEYYAAGVKEFPRSYVINQLAAKLINQ